MKRKQLGSMLLAAVVMAGSICVPAAAEETSSGTPAESEVTYSAQTGLVQRFMYNVGITIGIKDAKIVSVAYEDSKKDIADQNIAYAETAMEGIQEQITQKGGISSVNDVDTVSGATLSSNGIRQAIAKYTGEDFDLTAANGKLVMGKEGEVGIADSIKKAKNFLKLAEDESGNVILPTEDELSKKSDAWKTLYGLYQNGVEMNAAKLENESSVSAYDEGILIAKIDEALIAVKAESGETGGHGGATAGDKSALTALVNKANALKQTDYTEASWKNLQTELAEANELLNLPKATQGALDTMLADLQSAMDSLVKNPEKPAVVKVSKITLSGISKKIAAKKSIQLTAKVAPANAANKAITWTTSNSKYATVNSKGKVTTKAAGAGKTVTITTKAKDGSGVKATYKIKIMKNSVKSISLKAKAQSVKAGKATTVKATVKTTGKSSVNKTLKWTSSNTKYATVNSKGKVTTKKAGKGKAVTITAQATDGSGKKKTVKIKIK